MSFNLGDDDPEPPSFGLRFLRAVAAILLVAVVVTWLALMYSTR